ncbi:hypothetical protein Tco_0366079 [Tanacetum coccineum]
MQNQNAEAKHRTKMQRQNAEPKRRGCKDDCKRAHQEDVQLLRWKARELEVQRKQDLIIMAQQQHAADVHPDELCPPNKRYDLMDANKKVDLEHIMQSAVLALSITFNVDYAAFLWERLYFRFIIQHLRFPYPRLQKIIEEPQNQVECRLLAWMIIDEMKQTEHIQMYGRESSAHKKRSTLAPRRSTVIRLRIPERRSTRLTPPAPVPNVDKADEMILQDTLQVSLAEHKSHEEQEARENVALVDEHLASEEIDKMVEGQDNIVDDSSIPRNDESNIPGTRIEPRSDKESLEAEITQETEVEITQETPVVNITNVVIPVNVNDEDEEITDEVYELKRREKGKIVEETRNSPIPTPIRSPRIHTNLVSSDTEKLQELTDTPHTTSSSSSPHKKLAKTNRLLSLFNTKPTRFKRYKSFFHELQGRYGYLFAHLWARTLPTRLLILERKKAKEETDRLIAKAIIQERGNIQAQNSTQIENAIANVTPSQVDASVRSYMSGHILHVHPAQSQTSSVPDQQYQLYLAMKADPQLQQQTSNMIRKHPHDDAHPEGENSAKRYKTSEYEAYVSGESSSGQVFQEEQALSTSGNQEQDDDFDFWTDSYASDDDKIPTKHKGNFGPEKIVLSLHKFPSVIFNDDNIEERTSRWVNKYVRKFNPYARYGVEHWKNPHAKIFYIRKQKEPGKPKEEVYSNSKIIQVVKTY